MDRDQKNLVHVISGKIGYGTVSEALAYKLPFVFVRRDYFNEEPFLRNMLEVWSISYKRKTLLHFLSNVFFIFFFLSYMLVNSLMLVRFKIISYDSIIKVVLR